MEGLRLFSLVVFADTAVASTCSSQANLTVEEARLLVAHRERYLEKLEIASLGTDQHLLPSVVFIGFVKSEFT